MKRVKFGLMVFSVPLAIFGLSYLTNERCRAFTESHPGWTLVVIALFAVIAALITTLVFSDWISGSSPEDRSKKDCRIFSGGDTGHDCCDSHDHHHNCGGGS